MSEEIIDGCLSSNTAEDKSYIIYPPTSLDHCCMEIGGLKREGADSAAPQSSLGSETYSDILRIHIYSLFAIRCFVNNLVYGLVSHILTQPSSCDPAVAGRCINPNFRVRFSQLLCDYGYANESLGLFRFNQCSNYKYSCF